MLQGSVMACRCDELDEMRGMQAARYADAHLEEVSAEPKEWRIHYQCPQTGALWTLDYTVSPQFPGQRIVRLRSRSVPPSPPVRERRDSA